MTCHSRSAQSQFHVGHASKVTNLFAKIYLMTGAIWAGLSVVLSAALAHLPLFASGLPVMVQTALTQHQFHSLGLMLVGLALPHRPSRWLISAGALMLAGMLMFSFNIYARSVLGWETARSLVPWGGACWILAWVCMTIGFWRKVPKAISNLDD